MSGICYVWVGFLIEKTPLKNTRGGVGARRLLAGIKTIRDQPTEQITFRIDQSVNSKSQTFPYERISCVSGGRFLVRVSDQNVATLNPMTAREPLLDP